MFVIFEVLHSLGDIIGLLLLGVLFVLPWRKREVFAILGGLRIFGDKRRREQAAPNAALDHRGDSDVCGLGLGALGPAHLPDSVPAAEVCARLGPTLRAPVAHPLTGL